MADTKVMQAILDAVVLIQTKLNGLDKKVENMDHRLTQRLDKLGAQLAYLEEDAPTRKEFDKLEKRVIKVERRVASV